MERWEEKDQAVRFKGPITFLTCAMNLDIVTAREVPDRSLLSFPNFFLTHHTIISNR